jgi:S-formylglutathione hydrolase FrmB
MTLTRVEGAPGGPYGDALRGTFERVVVESEVLAGNPPGDPTRRPLYVYLPPGAGDSERRFPTIYLIQGLTGQVDMWLNRAAFEPTMIERVDELFARADVPPCIVVFVDAWTSYGGSQFVNSSATGRYMDYLCDEVVAFVDDSYPTIPERDHRGLTGKSSGGYGAMVVPMMRPDVFGALATHAGDALFEACYLPEFPQTVRILRDKFEGSYDVFWERFRAAERLDFDSMGTPMNTYCMAACYSPDDANPGKVILPFDIETGRLHYDVWARWLEWDPVRMVAKRVDALESMRCIYIDAGKSDEWYLDLGASAFAKELDKVGVSYSLDLFDAGHMGIQFRYPRALETLARALSPAE